MYSEPGSYGEIRYKQLDLMWQKAAEYYSEDSILLLIRTGFWFFCKMTPLQSNEYEWNAPIARRMAHFSPRQDALGMTCVTGT